MTKKKTPFSFSHFGFSTILLSFVMICVVTFSALTLITAHSDYRLSQKVAEKNQKYYQAQEQAYSKINTIEQLLTHTYLDTTCKEAYYAQLVTELTYYGTYLTNEQEAILSFSEPIAEDRSLCIKLRIKYPQNASDTFFEIIEWKSVYIREMPEDTYMNLIQ